MDEFASDENERHDEKSRTRASPFEETAPNEFACRGSSK
jgi:hypothetical protein